jgi:myo-inositol-1(or 4)-monophosphatase
MRTGRPEQVGQVRLLGDENASAPYQWLIDPIDGTKYYAVHSDLYSISVGLVYRRLPVLGVVHVPSSGQSFQARVHS